MKDVDNALQVNRQPGPLVPLLGGRVDQFYALTAPVPVSGTWGGSNSKEWAELLSTSDPDTKVLMKYGKSNGWLDNQPAAITRKVGKGSITYIGAWLDEPAMRNAAKWMTDMAGVEPKFGKVPDNVDVYPREGEHGKVFILVNFAKFQQTITLPKDMQNVLEGTTVKSVTLPVYGVAVLSDPK
jgi:beta-galactosidase